MPPAWSCSRSRLVRRRKKDCAVLSPQQRPHCHIQRLSLTGILSFLERADIAIATATMTSLEVIQPTTAFLTTSLRKAPTNAGESLTRRLDLRSPRRTALKVSFSPARELDQERSRTSLTILTRNQLERIRNHLYSRRATIFAPETEWPTTNLSLVVSCSYRSDQFDDFIH